MATYHIIPIVTQIHNIVAIATRPHVKLFQLSPNNVSQCSNYHTTIRHNIPLLIRRNAAFFQLSHKRIPHFS